MLFHYMDALKPRVFPPPKCRVKDLVDADWESSRFRRQVGRRAQGLRELLEPASRNNQEESSKENSEDLEAE